MEDDRTLRGLKEKRIRLQEYLAASRRLKLCLESQGMDEALREIERRQEIIGQIDRMAEETEIPTGQAPLLIKEGPGFDQEEIVSLLREIAMALQAIREIDEECRKILTNLRDEIKEERDKVGRNILTVRFYTRGSHLQPALIDLHR